MIVYENRFIVIDDISDELPKHKDKVYQSTEARKINKIVVHHTGGSVTRGKQAVIDTAWYHVRDNGWPGIGYHYFLHYFPDEANRRYVVYKCNDHSTVSYHCANNNRDSIGVAFQGCFTSKHNPEQKPFRGQPSGNPSTKQMLCFVGLMRYLEEQYHGVPYHTHSMYNKPTCPGDFLDDFVLSIPKK